VCGVVAGVAEQMFKELTGPTPYEPFMRQLGLEKKKKKGQGVTIDVLKTIAGHVKDILYVPAGAWGPGDSGRIQDLKELRAHLSGACERWGKHEGAKDLGRELAREFRSYRVRDHFNRTTLPRLVPKPYSRNPLPHTLFPKPKIRNSKPETRNSKPETRNPKPKRLNHKPKPQTPKPQALHPQSRISSAAGAVRACRIEAIPSLADTSPVPGQTRQPPLTRKRHPPRTLS